MLITIFNPANGSTQEIEADKFLLAAQSGSKFTKSFSSSDLIDQIGLIEFMRQQVLAEIHKGGGNNDTRTVGNMAK